MSELKIECLTDPCDILTIRRSDTDGKDPLEIEIDDGYEGACIIINKAKAVQIVNHLVQEYQLNNSTVERE